MYEIIKINGATVIFSPLGDRETAALGIFLRIGSRYEQPRFRGIAHFVEHMLFKGSKNYSYKKIKQEIEGRGGALNGFTSQEITAYYATFLKKNLAPTVDILLDMVSRPLFKPEDIEKERSVILQEIKMYNDLPSSRVVMHLDKLIWPKHSLGEEVIGNGETVSRINRNDLTEFLNNYYRASNMVIACSGNIDREQLLTLLAEKIKKDVSLIKLNANAPRGLTGQAVITENKQLEQAHLCLGFRGIKYADPQRVAAELLNVVLGANMSSRLFEEIREKKALCYDVSTELRKFRDSGALVIHLGLDSQKIDLALKTIFGELKKIKEKNISSGELSRAKDYLLGQTTMALERPQGRMFCFAETLITLNRVLTLEEMKQEINAVTGEEIKKIAGDIFDFSKACVSCIGELPLDKEKTIRRIING